MRGAVSRIRLITLVMTLVVVTAIAAGAVMRLTTEPGETSSALIGKAMPPPVSPKVDAAMNALDLIAPPRQKLAEDFTVTTLDGRTVRLGDQRGKVVFINFWATWCPPCREEMPAMERLLKRGKKDGLVMLAVSVDADASAVTSFVVAQRFTFTVGLDPKMELARAYGVRALPASFIIDRHGLLAALALGPRAWDDPASQALIEGLSRR